ncbi:MAG TPA: DUF2007 domain-containing protein [Peptococcaceae bacterium]|nr:DUF2007 domain-containing protein [Peptococcaceae bacterium]
MDGQAYDDWKLVYTCTEEQEAEMIESFLREEQIHTLRTYPGFSDITRIVAGMTKLGVNIYVRESQFEEALKIIEDITSSFELFDE